MNRYGGYIQAWTKIDKKPLDLAKGPVRGPFVALVYVWSITRWMEEALHYEILR